MIHDVNERYTPTAVRKRVVSDDDQALYRDTAQREWGSSPCAKLPNVPLNNARQLRDRIGAI